MKHPTKRELRALADAGPPPCVSIYLPVHRGAAGSQQNPTAIESLLARAEAILESDGLEARAIRELLAPMREIVKVTGLFAPSARGLALFCTRDLLRHVQLRSPVVEGLTVGQCFHLRPLLAALDGTDYFYVLAISDSRVRLLRGTRDGLLSVDVADLPEGLAGVLSRDAAPGGGGGSVRSAGPSRRGRRSPFTDGPGSAGGEARKEDLLKYFRAIDRELRAMLSEERAPLVLAGVDYYFPLYRRVNSYLYLLEKGIPGSPDRLVEKDLHAAAWKIVQPYCRSKLMEAIAKYDRLERRGRTTCSLDEVLSRAHEGQVAVLFVSAQDHVWGRYDQETRGIVVRTKREPADGDLLDLAVSRTLANGGTVFVTDRETIPGGGVTAAGLRD